MDGGANLRAKEIRDFWKEKGRRLEMQSDGKFLDPGAKK
jgi:hypothetical protein